ncbi:MAG: hypothetical protein M3406_00360 [Chloroflexota bacterium]|nr:hypothetical protein [Chloroflexota bacterium]
MPPEGSRPIFSRAEVLKGLPARRASTLLFAIESRTAELVARSRAAMATFRTERSEAERERQFLAAMAAGREPPLRPRIQDVERYAPLWAPLVPADVDVRAALARLIGAKYVLRKGDVPRIRAVLGLDAAQVEDAYERLHGTPVAGIYAATIPLRERLRWRRSRMAAMLEELPPFWTAFALTLTETVGAGVLALPIALAGLGPLAAVVLLVGFGAVNLVTIAALVEAITRSGSIRYGSAYLGRVVGDYLGAPGKATVGLALFALNAVLLLVLCIGFGLTIGAATGIPPAVCAALLFVVVVSIVRRESLDVTVASALVIGGVNLAVLLLISLLAASHIQPGALGADPVLAGLDLDALLGLAIGVVVASYFGHSSAANAAKVVLARDPTGRALLWGNLAAMIAVIGIYAVVVVAITGAVGPARLLDFPGTAVTPLAEVAGPAVSLLGAIYVALAMGLGSVHVALGLFNQMGEVLPRSDERAGRRAWFTTGAGRTVARFLPLAILFVILEWLILSGRESFTGVIGYLGVLIVPILAGVFPMLMLAASRRRGAYVPGVVLRAIGHPAMIVAVATIYLIAVLVHGLIIWEGPIERVAAVGASVLTLTVAVLAIRRGSLQPRAILEIRSDERFHGRVTIGLTVAGDMVPVDLAVERHTADRAAPADPGDRGDPGRLEGLRAITLSVPDELPPLEIWAHRVDGTGDSTPLPLDIELAGPGPGPVAWLSASRRLSALPAGTQLRVRFGVSPAAVPRRAQTVDPTV